MGGKRMIITLPDDDRAWIAGYSEAHNISSAEAIRRAIQRLKNDSEKDTYLILLEKTRGLWTRGDGLQYQDKVRSEWN